MAIHHLTLGALRSASGPSAEAGPADVVVVDLDPSDAGGEPLAPIDVAAAGVVIGVTTAAQPDAHPAARACDVVLAPGDPALDAVCATLRATPIAARAFVIHMRGADDRAVEAGLAAESAVYSTLQGGPEFAAWRASRPPKVRAPEGDPITVTRDGGTLVITLDRPHARNALSTAMRDALVEAFAVPALDPSVTAVHLRGAGPAFCAGGDLDEFGSFPDPATAHLIRLQQSIGRAIHQVSDRVTAHLHGACAGSGIELPAFAGRVVADRDTRISLPELALGLIPGAGGTVSLPRRIGRHRTTRLALTGEVIDAPTALAWGLVDALAPP